MAFLRLATAAASLALFSGSAATAACGPMTLFGPGDRLELRYSDLDGDGKVSPGDKRFGRIALQNQEGKDVGLRMHVVTVAEVDGAGQMTRAAVDMIYAFEDGEIFAFLEIDQPALPVTDTSKALPLKTVTSTITGGTGAYTEAKGTVRHVFEDNGATFEIDVTCE